MRTLHAVVLRAGGWAVVAAKQQMPPQHPTPGHSPAAPWSAARPAAAGAGHRAGAPPPPRPCRSALRLGTGLALGGAGINNQQPTNCGVITQATLSAALPSTEAAGAQQQANKTQPWAGTHQPAVALRPPQSLPAGPEPARRSGRRQCCMLSRVTHPAIIPRAAPAPSDTHRGTAGPQHPQHPPAPSQSRPPALQILGCPAWLAPLAPATQQPGAGRQGRLAAGPAGDGGRSNFQT